MMRVATVAALALSSLACAAPGISVSEADVGASAWPFTVSAGTLRCTLDSYQTRRPLVTLDTGDGIHYGLNGAAISAGFPTHRAILKPGKAGVDVQPFIDRGHTLCPQP
jgi:hypothetical protein